MKLKQLIKRSFLFSGLVQSRYLFYRYVLKRQYRSFRHLRGIRIAPIETKISFFGYYNISPANLLGDIIFLEVDTESPRASMKSSARIMLKDRNSVTRNLASTSAWNWQQGCMLQWLPNHTDQIIFNDYDSKSDRYISRVIDKSANEVVRYQIPVANVSKCGRFALSLNYNRLAQMRPDYGYFNKKIHTLPSDNEDGIWFLDLKSGDYKLILSLQDLKDLDYTNSMDMAQHKVNHIDVNPNGTRMMFLHRWVGPQGRFMRLITANPDGSDPFVLNGDVMTSHCCWLSANEILAFCKYKTQTGYFKFFDQTNRARILSEKLPTQDGHPSISPNGRFLITDTYPDKARMSKLILYEIATDQPIELGQFFEPFEYNGEMRIDLHPKWAIDGKSIYFESGHNCGRKLYQLYGSLLNDNAK